jgi:hypothetical protein
MAVYRVLPCLFVGLLLFSLVSLGQVRKFDIFNYKAPPRYALKDSSNKVFYELIEGTKYCQLYLFPAVQGENDVEKDFQKDWESYAAKPFGIKAPEPSTKARQTMGGMDVLFGASRGTYNNIQFVVTVTTYAKDGLTWCVASVFNDQKYIETAQAFSAGVEANTTLFAGKTMSGKQASPSTLSGNSKASTGITLSTTHFDDGWKATPAADYVLVSRQNLQARLYYVNTTLDDARPNTVSPEQWYWSKIVQPAFSVGNPQKWEGVNYPVIYFQEGEGIDKSTGAKVYVAMKVVYQGGANVVVVTAPSKAAYQAAFGHPNDVDRMLGYNKFGVTKNDILGTWSKTGGGGVEYYNAYTGNYTGMSAISSEDEFTFNSDDSYSSMHNAANTNSGSTTFSALNYKGKFSVNVWELMATNRVSGKTKKFWCQLMAVKNGYILTLTDSDYEPLKYVLFKRK